MRSTTNIVEVLLTVTGCWLAISGSPVFPWLLTALVAYRRAMATA